MQNIFDCDSVTLISHIVFASLVQKRRVTQKIELFTHGLTRVLVIGSFSGKSETFRNNIDYKHWQE